MLYKKGTKVLITQGNNIGKEYTIEKPCTSCGYKCGFYFMKEFTTYSLNELYFKVISTPKVKEPEAWM